MQGMLRRAARSARLDKQVFREVVEDEGTVLNALGLVVLSGIAMAVGMSGGFGAVSYTHLTLPTSDLV